MVLDTCAVFLAGDGGQQTAEIAKSGRRHHRIIYGTRVKQGFAPTSFARGSPSTCKVACGISSLASLAPVFLGKLFLLGARVGPAPAGGFLSWLVQNLQELGWGNDLRAPMFFEIKQIFPIPCNQEIAASNSSTSKEHIILWVWTDSWNVLELDKDGFCFYKRNKLLG